MWLYLCIQQSLDRDQDEVVHLASRCLKRSFIWFAARLTKTFTNLAGKAWVTAFIKLLFVKLIASRIASITYQQGDHVLSSMMPRAGVVLGNPAFPFGPGPSFVYKCIVNWSCESIFVLEVCVKWRRERNQMWIQEDYIKGLHHFSHIYQHFYSEGHAQLIQRAYDITWTSLSGVCKCS